MAAAGLHELVHVLLVIEQIVLRSGRRPRIRLAVNEQHLGVVVFEKTINKQVQGIVELYILGILGQEQVVQITARVFDYEQILQVRGVVAVITELPGRLNENGVVDGTTK